MIALEKIISIHQIARHEKQFSGLFYQIEWRKLIFLIFQLFFKHK